MAVTEHKLTVTWYSRSWVQISVDDTVIHIDPVFFDGWEYPVGLGETFGKADRILVTHAHKSHCNAELVTALSGGNTTVVGHPMCHGVLGDGVRYMEEGDIRQVRGLTLETIPAYNTEHGSSTKKIHERGCGSGYIMGTESLRIYHAGDTDQTDEMAELVDIDIAFLPMGGTFTMDASEAVMAADAIGTRSVIPIHRLSYDLSIGLPLL